MSVIDLFINIIEHETEIRIEIEIKIKMI